MDKVAYTEAYIEALIKNAKHAQNLLECIMDSYDYFLMLPHKDSRLNHMICGALEATLEKLSETEKFMGVPKVLVLTEMELAESEWYDLRNLSKYDLDSILDLYRMYEFTDKLMIGSFELPYERRLNNLIAARIALEEDLIYSIILNPLIEGEKHRNEKRI